MKAYLRWSLRQLYLLLFWPTQFEREVEGPLPGQPQLRFGERFRYLLKMLPWIVALVALGNLVVGRTCEAFEIAFRWEPSWVGVAPGVALGVASGVASGVVLGVVLGVALGVAFGVASGVVLGVAFGMALGVAFWLAYFRLVTYPFDAALAATAYFTGRRWPHAVAQAWRLCPVAWDEVIWLPLPFVSKLLALLVQHDREEGFRQIAFVAAERPLQRRAARVALVKVTITDLQVKSFPQLANVTSRLDWLTLGSLPP